MGAGCNNEYGVRNGPADTAVSDDGDLIRIGIEQLGLAIHDFPAVFWVLEEFGLDRVEEFVIGILARNDTADARKIPEAMPSQ